jgi:pimeloyl-ACP methyl ester carboxylesterase
MTQPDPPPDPSRTSDASGAELIVFLHGLFESPAVWDAQRAALEARGHRTAALPLPGHRADAIGGERAALLTADDTALARHMADQIAARSGGRPVRLVGHSLGAYLTLSIARQRPELLRDALVVGALFAGDCGRPQTIGSWLVTQAPAIGMISARLLLRHWLDCPERFDGWLSASMAPGERLRVGTAAMRSELSGADAQAMRALACWIARRQALSDITQIGLPVTCVISARDPVVAPSHQLALARALPRGVVHVIDSGHLPMFTTPGRLARALTAWAARPAPDRPETDRVETGRPQTGGPAAARPSVPAPAVAASSAVGSSAAASSTAGSPAAATPSATTPAATTPSAKTPAAALSAATRTARARPTPTLPTPTRPAIRTADSAESGSSGSADPQGAPQAAPQSARRAVPRPDAARPPSVRGPAQPSPDPGRPAAAKPIRSTPRPRRSARPAEPLPRPGDAAGPPQTAPRPAAERIDPARSTSTGTAERHSSARSEPPA